MEAALDAQARLLAQPGRVHVRDHPAACAATGLLPVRRRAHSCDSPGQPRRHPPRQRPRPTPDPHAHAPDGEAPGAFAHDKLDAYRIACELAALANKIGAQIPRGPRNIADQLLRSASNPVLLLAEGGLSGSARRQYNNTARGRARARAGEECGVARGAWSVEGEAREPCGRHQARADAGRVGTRTRLVQVGGRLRAASPRKPGQNLRRTELGRPRMQREKVPAHRRTVPASTVDALRRAPKFRATNGRPAPETRP
jgi:hypothetical protein